MRGVMNVVEELGASILAANEIATEDIPAEGRDFVEFWSLDLLRDEANAILANRSYETGKSMFEVAACVQCHTMRGEGKDLGPDLTSVRHRYSALNVLEHILNPSLLVAEEYRTYVIETEWDGTYYGQIISQDNKTVTVLSNPLAPETAVTLQRSDIQSLESMNASPMPMDLLITLEKEEIWDLVAYILSGDDANDPAFK